MESELEEDNAMCERILTDIEHIIYTDSSLKEFSIVPVTENKNKSPILYEDHNLGLEFWCVKHVYRYLYKELFKMRRLLHKNRLPQHKAKKLNKLLIGALLINPDVSTFWNMRRELIQYREIGLDKELILVRLVLSHRCKSNEAFAYRKWILCRFMKSINGLQVTFATTLLEREFTLSEMAAEKAQNNYHAWGHRIWAIEKIAVNSYFSETTEYLSKILEQLDFSSKWISKHVSEHAGFHYRQYLCNCIFHNIHENIENDIKYRYFVVSFIGFNNCSYSNAYFLHNLIGKRTSFSSEGSQELKCYNYVFYFMILLFDLFHFIDKLNQGFPGHESIWCHRRFVVFNLLKAAYDYHGITWKRCQNINSLYPGDSSTGNIVNHDFGSIDEPSMVSEENGEKSPKQLKYETDRVESSYLYKRIVESESKFVRENVADKCNNVQRELARRYKKWLKLILSIDVV